MGKKKGGGGGGGENEKVVAARDRKAAQKEEKGARQAKQEEDTYWAEAGAGAKSKAQKKKEEADQRAAEAAKKKREAKLLAEAEEKALAKSAAGKAAAAKDKMTAFERSKIKMTDQQVAAREAKEREMAGKRQVSEEDYARQMRLDEANTNRNEDEIVATGVDQALNALTVGEASSSDIHPEKRVKAAFAAYHEANLPQLKAEKPGLRANQYRDMLWKQFQKSPENPMNRAALAK
eukprot:jgi/Tetstr1/443008/TSEL_031068.t1